MEIEYVDVSVTEDNLAAMMEFCGWPVRIGDVIPINKELLAETH